MHSYGAWDMPIGTVVVETHRWVKVGDDTWEETTNSVRHVRSGFIDGLISDEVGVMQ